MVLRRKVIASFVKLLFSALLTTFALILMMQGFGWFSTGRSTTASGQHLQTKGVDILEIRANAEGEDIGVTVAEKTMDKLPMDDGTPSTLRPGISGSFSFYVHDGSVGETTPYSFRYGVSVENNQFHEGAAFPEGFYPNISGEEQVRAKDYINAHLLFFTKKEDGKYSGWIKPGNSMGCNVENSSPYQVTVYWVWVSWYQQIFDENSDLIEEGTRQEIAAYYSEEGNKNKMFADGTQTAEAYNMADTFIGVTLKYVCFQIDVCKE